MISLHAISDIDTLMRWRAEVIRTVFDTEPSEELLQANQDYYRSHILKGEHLAFVASVGGAEAGCGGVCFSEELPSPDNPSGRCGYLMNIYVREEYRHRGLAHIIVANLIKESMRRECGKIYLESTDAAKHLYTEIGFEEMQNMLKYGN